MDFIYALRDPRDNQIKYVGKSKNPQSRLKLHLRDGYNPHKTNWIKGLLSQGLTPLLTIIEQVPPEQRWQDREKYWIKHYRGTGAILTNKTDGGDGGPDCTGMHLVKSEQARKNIVAALVKRNKTPEMREVSRKNGLAVKGRKMSPEDRKRRSIAATGKKMHTDEFKRELSERNRTRTYDPARMRENANKFWADPSKSANLRDLLRERFSVYSKSDHPPHRFDSEKISERVRAFWDDPIKGPLNRKRLSEQSKKRCGEKHPQAKLTELKVLEIRDSTDVPAMELAVRYGVTPNMIRAIWK